MIASNYRKFPDAMALQLVLAFGRCSWHTSRPTTRQGRAVRAERSRLVKKTPQVVQWVAKAVPAWWKEAKRKARALAKRVRDSIDELDLNCLDRLVDTCARLQPAWPTKDPLDALWDQAYRNHGHKWEASQFKRTMVLGAQLWEHYGTGEFMEAAEHASAYRD